MSPAIPFRILAILALGVVNAFIPGAAQAASFDCDKAKAPDEKAICANRSLNDQDVRMSVYLEALGGLQLMGANGDMREEQRQWLAKRRECGARAACLADVYKTRVDKLRADYLATANARR